MHFVRLNKCHLAALSQHSLRLCGESFSGCASPQRRRERRGGAELFSEPENLSPNSIFQHYDIKIYEQSNFPAAEPQVC